MTRDSWPQFGVTTSVGGTEAVVAVQGRIERQGTFTLGTTLDAAIDRHPASIVLDVPEPDSPAGWR